MMMKVYVLNAKLILTVTLTLFVTLSLFVVAFGNGRAMPLITVDRYHAKNQPRLCHPLCTFNSFATYSTIHVYYVWYKGTTVFSRITFNRCKWNFTIFDIHYSADTLC